MTGKQRPSPGGQARPGGQAKPNRQAETLTQWASRNPHPTGKQRPSPGRQRPSPARAPTRTSRRVGIGQGDLPHIKEAASASRMHGNHKEQYGSHSLNRWKERFALQHRHAGMSTGSEPYTWRGIFDKGAWALMTRLGPSHDEGPGTQPHIGTMLVSEFFSLYMLYSVLSVLRQVQCVQLRRGQTMLQCILYERINLWLGQWPNITYINKECCKVFNWEEDKAMIRTVTLMFQYHVSSTDTMCSIKESVPIDRAVAQYYLCI